MSFCWEFFTLRRLLANWFLSSSTFRMIQRGNKHNMHQYKEECTEVTTMIVSGWRGCFFAHTHNNGAKSISHQFAPRLCYFGCAMDASLCCALLCNACCHTRFRFSLLSEEGNSWWFEILRKQQRHNSKIWIGHIKYIQKFNCPEILLRSNICTTK